MSKTNVFIDYVNELSAEDFKQLKDACDKRIDKELYGVTTFEEAVLEYGRIPICPKCGSDNYCLDGKTNANHNRYLCLDCNSAYTLLSNSIFNSSKISFHKLMNYINLISFNVPYELIAEILDIGLNSTIAHDGDHSHYELIKKLNLKEEVYKANSKDEYYLKNMALINNMCAWLKRYIWRFIGMDINNLQSYLNWFIYLQRVKRDNEKWPKTTRILRHLVLSNTKLTRK